MHACMRGLQQMVWQAWWAANVGGKNSKVLVAEIRVRHTARVVLTIIHAAYPWFVVFSCCAAPLVFVLLGLGAYFGYTRGSLPGRQQAKGRWVYDRSLGGIKVRQIYIPAGHQHQGHA